MFSIYKILKNHDEEQQLLHRELPQKQSSDENILQDLPSNTEGKTIDTFENTDSFTNEFTDSTHDTEVDDSSENSESSDFSYIGKRVIVKEKHQLNRKRKDILKRNKFATSKQKRKNKIPIKKIQAANFGNGKFNNSFFARNKPSGERNELHRKQYLNRLQTNDQRFSRLNKQNYVLKVHKNVNNVSKVTKNDVVKLNHNYDTVRGNFKKAETASFKYLARNNANTLRKQDPNLNTEIIKDYKLPDVLNAVKKVSHSKKSMINPKRLQKHRISSMNYLNRNHHLKLETFTKLHSDKEILFPKHIISGLKRKMFSPTKFSFNDNSSAAVTKNENFASENERENLVHLSSSDKNFTGINETDSRSLFLVEHGLSIKNFDVSGVVAKRKERFVTGNYSAFNWQVFLRNVTKNGFSYVLEHKTATGAISLISVVIMIILIVMISICCKTKRRRYEAEKEYLPLNTSDSVSNDDSVAFKKREIERRSFFGIFKKGRKQQKYTTISSHHSKNNSNENINKLYSIGSETDEDEENHSVQNKSKNLKFSKNCDFVVKKELQQNNHVLKTPEYCHSKLLKLHKNLSERTGNVCYTDALKNSKMKPNSETPKPSRKHLMKNNFPYDHYLYQANDQSCNYFKKGKINKDFENFSILQNEDDDKNSNITKSDEIFEEFDPSNPFYEDLDVNNEL